MPAATAHKKFHGQEKSPAKKPVPLGEIQSGGHPLPRCKAVVEKKSTTAAPRVLSHEKVGEGVTIRSHSFHRRGRAARFLTCFQEP